MSSNTFKNLAKKKEKKTKKNKQKIGVNLFGKSKSNSVSNINNDETEFIKKKTNDFSLINETLIPISYMRISKRFPHLNLQEIIDFEKRVIDNGGSIETHSGDFELTKRLFTEHWSEDKTNFNYYNSWTCCWNKYHSTDNYEYKPLFFLYPKLPPPPTVGTPAYIECMKDFNKINEFPNLKNPRPDLKCCRSEIFYLNEEDEKIQKVNIEEINSVINNNIDIFKKTIDNYSAKINELENIKTNIK